ncbi:AraC family transcriptional regulator ligand-binding domain-containing protein [Pseudosulfitobacter sp. SM2401]|uniref:AraC family transcriptional regulator ligand-binding domain-containing protein n=1 Tax=Pseudosulfitobacter sp. SM2401 TaxID=3350098 RepID=UPI0036F31807
MTDYAPKYKIARTMEQFCALLQISLDDVLTEMDLPADYLETEGRGVSAEQYFDGWSTAVELANRPDLPLFLGQAYARGPFNPAFFAFTCSPTVLVGLERLSVFKPLVGPLRLDILPDGNDLRLVKSSTVTGLDLPHQFAATEMVFFVEAMRICTGHPVRPSKIVLSEKLECHDALVAYFGIEITYGNAPELSILKEDAARPLLSRNPAQWATMEPEFRRELEALSAGQTMTARVRKTLSEMLPSGLSNITETASRMHMSTRSLQRHLSSESQSYQAVLDDTRRTLALHYLRHTDLNTEEISFLLAYRDPNSFYRAFQSWTGMTPKAARIAS